MKPIGRPPTLKSATRRNIYIPDALWELAKTIGSGSSAEGIRIALKAYKNADSLKSITKAAGA